MVIAPTSCTCGTTTFGGIASTSNTNNQYRGSSLAPYRITPEADGIDMTYPTGKINSISAMPIYKDQSHEELRLQDYELQKGPKFSVQNKGNAFQQSNFQPTRCWCSSFGTVATTPASNVSVNEPLVSTGSVLGFPNNRGFGFKSSSVSGESNAPCFATGSASSGFSTFAFPATSVFGQSDISSANNVSTTPGFGIWSMPSFSSTASCVISSFSGPTCTCALSTSGSQFNSTSSSNTCSVFGVQGSPGSGVVNGVEKFYSISAMPIYEDKSHEELRSEYYELHNIGGHTPWGCQSSFKTSDTPANIFHSPTLLNHSSVRSPFEPIKSNLFAPTSQDLFTPINASSTASTLSPSPNPFSPANPSPSQSQAFWHVNSFTPAFNANLNHSSLSPSDKSMPTNSSQCPAISRTFSGPSLSAFSFSKLPASVSPSTQSTSIAALGPWPSVNASQPGQTAEKTYSCFINNPSQPSQASNSLATVAEVAYQNINGQQYVPESTLGMQSSVAVAPFYSRSAVDRPDTVTSVQYGISSLPVRNNLSPNRRTSLSRIRHVSLRHNSLPVQKLSCASSESKVPFFSDRPCPVVPILPRENPRAWVKNSLSFHSSSDGQGCEDNDLPSSFFQLNINPTKEDLSTISNSHQDDDASVIKKHVADILDLMPKLPNGEEYYTEPSINGMAAKEMAVPGSCRCVNDFVIGRLGYGSIKYLGETDVRHLDLESVVKFNNREVILYADQNKKPPVGQGLIKLAEITMLNVKCISRKTGKQYVDGPRVQMYEEMLMRKGSEQGAEFVSYDPVRGEWKFRVQHL